MGLGHVVPFEVLNIATAVADEVVMLRAFGIEARGAPSTATSRTSPAPPDPADCYKWWPWKIADPCDSRLRRFPQPWDACYFPSGMPSQHSAAACTATRCPPETA